MSSIQMEMDVLVLFELNLLEQFGVSTIHLGHFVSSF